METLPLSEVKARFSEIADEVVRTHQRISITRNGKAYAVLLAARDLESLEATLEWLAEPGIHERLREEQRALDAGEGISGEEMAKLMEERRLRERPGA
ncbi:MAG: type II toxin-antitoxin system Phd/YefM family antitoxin [Mycobacteriales bacterium]|nr:type II toxin-antitoxin system Phd/YefM family antitoxin [Frankia sp.]